MKTDVFARLLYRTNPLLVAGYTPTQTEAYLKLVPKESFKHGRQFYIVDGPAANSKNWDEEWFGNYE